MRKLFSTGLFVLSSLLCLGAQDAVIFNFIDRYREIAIEEMHRSGIPASIKLAQAILESDAGQSDLAVNSNNHFGLKCGVEWDGPTYYKKDDDRDRKGRLIPSCFRAFSTPEESFVAHSEFLKDPRKSYRYSFLFDLDPLDYKSWAWGLRQSGYATNPRYAVLLISLIEKYELYTYDYYQPQSLLASINQAPTPPPKPTYQHSLIQRRLQSPEWKKEPEKVPNIEGVVTNNGLDMVYARAEDTPESIAERYSRSLKEIILFNEKIEHRDQVLEFTERVYFEKKKRSYKGSIKFHVVEEDETMYDIAQTYGLLLEKLYIRNRMYPGTEPAIGERVKLRGMVKVKNRPKLRHVSKKDLAAEVVPTVSRIDRSIESRKKHVVTSGDTLYAIAQQYQLSIDVLKKINKLESNLIRLGQILFVD